MKFEFSKLGKTDRQVLLLTLIVTLMVTAGAIHYILQEEDIYDSLQIEDGIVEYLTVLFFFGAGIIFLYAMLAKKSRVRELFKDYRLLLVILGILCIYAALEEISFGQRIVGWESPEYFEESSTQEETDTHNIRGLEFIFAIAAFLLVLYGVVVPFGLRYCPGRFEWFREILKIKIPYPPLQAALFFAIGVLFIIMDVVSELMGNQVVGNEYQEFFFGYAFLLFALYLFDEEFQAVMKVDKSKTKEPTTPSARSPPK